MKDFYLILIGHNRTEFITAFELVTNQRILKKQTKLIK